MKRSVFLRLNKYLAKYEGMSRRAADQLIVQNQISVNGAKVKNLGVQIDVRKDKVKIKNSLVIPRSLSPIYFMFNKPEKILTTMDDPKERPTVMDYFKKKKNRIFPVGRLDWDSEGLLLLTNDGDFAQRILHPTEKIPKTYFVKLKGSPSVAQLNRLLTGVSTPFGKKRALFVSRTRSGSQANIWIKIIIDEGKNRQIRLMFQSLGYRVSVLRRGAVGRLNLGALKKGTFRRLTSKELLKIFQKPKELYGK